MIVIVNYGMGNVGSVLNMVQKVGGEAVVSSDPQAISQAGKLILPGVGAFDQGMRNLEELHLRDLLQEQVVQKKTPILGICLGLQLFTRGSEEGSRPGLGWLAANTVRFQPERASDPIRTPHMGWNTVRPTHEDPLLKGLEKENRFYFVHSFHLVCEDAGDVAGKTLYGYEFDSVIHRGNIMGTQFHPEKSHRFGMQVLKNFVRDI
jgi:glutamine amidotransferase